MPELTFDPLTMIPRPFENWNRACLTAEEAKQWVSPDNKARPFARFIGNDNAKEILSRAIFAALQRHNHALRDCSFSFIGGAGTGKATLAKLLAEEVDLPIAVVHAQRVNAVSDILLAIAQACETKPNLKMQEVATNSFDLPPMVVYIDEVHLLKDSVAQGLLRATDPKNRILTAELEWTADCRDVCWVVATTERGLLLDAFDARFIRVPLLPYSNHELAQIVQLNHPKWPFVSCEQIAKYGGHNACETLTLARDIELEYTVTGNLAQAIETVREKHQIDHHGLTYQRLNILKALNERPLALARLACVAACSMAEVERYVLPPLETTTPDSRALVTVGPRGYELTEAGCQALIQRGIPVKWRPK